MPAPLDRFQFTADRGDARLRLDQVLVRRVTDVSRLSRTLAQQWIDAGAVTVDGQTARRSAAPVREGASVQVRFPDITVLRARPVAEAGDLEVLYEDDCLLAINKPPGIVVHPTYKQTAHTLLNGVLWHLRTRVDTRPGILTRLDKDTSGLVLVALSSAVHAAVQRDAAAGRVRKEYLAVVAGQPRPAEGRIVAPLARDPQDRRRVIVTPGGALSETRYAVTSSHDGRSLVQCELVTGRTHQIRVHLASRGWPIIGDRVYGEPSTEIARQALHAWRVSLVHPVTRRQIDIEAPVAPDMRALVAAG